MANLVAIYADGWRVWRQHLFDMDGQRIAWRRSFDYNWPVLRVGERQAGLLAGLVRLGLDAAAEGIARIDQDTVTWIDGQHGLRIGPDREIELGLLFLGERVRLACLPAALLRLFMIDCETQRL